MRKCNRNNLHATSLLSSYLKVPLIWFIRRSINLIESSLVQLSSVTPSGITSTYLNRGREHLNRGWEQLAELLLKTVSKKKTTDHKPSPMLSLCRAKEFLLHYYLIACPRIEFSCRNDHWWCLCQVRPKSQYRCNLNPRKSFLHLENKGVSYRCHGCLFMQTTLQDCVSVLAKLTCFTPEIPDFQCSVVATWHNLHGITQKLCSQNLPAVSSQCVLKMIECHNWMTSTDATTTNFTLQNKGLFIHP